jgi:hypothetical protein
MRLAFLLIATLAIAGCSSTSEVLPVAAATTPSGNPTTALSANGLKCFIAIPERSAGARPLLIRVVLQNNSDKPLAIVDNWNSWGCFSLKFQYKTVDGVEHTLEKNKRRVWEMNGFSDTVLQPGEVFVRDADLKDERWTGVPDPGTISIRAVFTQGEDVRGEDEKTAVWIGTVESPPVEMQVSESTQGLEFTSR